jgi:acetyl esterase/lipase
VTIRVFVFAAVLLGLPLCAHAQTYGPYSAETYIECKPSRPVPGKVAVVVAHGNWATGGEQQEPAVRLCQALSAKGIYAVSIGYRMVYGAHWPALFQDAQTAIRWLRSKGYKTVGMAGTSAGGVLSLMAGAVEATVVSPATDPSGEAALYPGLRSQADFVIDISGPTDIGIEEANGANDAVLTGIPLPKGLAEASVSPITFITGTMPPTIIFEGLTDTFVTIPMAGELIRLLKDKGTTFQYQTYHGGHVFKGLPPAAVTACIDEATQFALKRTPGANNPSCEGPVPKK